MIKISTLSVARVVSILAITTLIASNANAFDARALQKQLQEESQTSAPHQGK